MCIEKDSTEIIMVDEEICVVGMSLQKSGLPISFESLGKLWEIYGEKYRGKVKKAVNPVVEYAICFNKIPDYLTGCSVSEIDQVNEECISFAIPKGRYIKDLFHADTFQQLTNEAMAKRNVKAWANKNKIKINKEFTIEVYPEHKNGLFEMYTLTPIAE